MCNFLKNLIKDLIPPEVPTPPEFNPGGFLLNYDDLEKELKEDVKECS